MTHTTVRVSGATRDQLRSLAAAEKKSMRVILAEAVEAYRRERFLRAVNRGYAAVREDPAAWTILSDERTAWEGVLLDGLTSGRPAGPPRRTTRKRRRTR